MPFDMRRLPKRVSVLYFLFGILFMMITLIPGTPIAQARPLFAATPSISVSTPGSLMIGQDFTFTVSFDNTGSSTGYGPFVDVIFPVNGVDGDPYATPAEVQDGIDFDATLGATYLGSKLECTVREFNSSGRAIHPYARDTNGDYLVVTGDGGDKLVSCKLPFGSFVPSQPSVSVIFNATLSELADSSAPLPIRARGGFMYGSDPLDNWCCDAIILSPSSNTSSTWQGGSPAEVTPTILTMDKSGSPPESETATGPNFPRTYTINVDIAAGQIVDNLTIGDSLPDNVQFIAMISPASCATEPSTTAPGGTLLCDLGSVTGGAGNDAQVQFSFYVPLEDAAASRVLKETTGASSTSENDAYVEGDWLPKDTRDQPSQHLAIGTPPSVDYTHTNKSIPVQKSSSVVGGGVVVPGATLEFTIEFQVSDYYVFRNVFLKDVISDGLHVDATFAPTLQINGNGYLLPQAGMGAANYDVSCNYSGGPGPECSANDPAADDGTTSLTFRVSDEIISRGHNGRLVGGCVPPAGLDSKVPSYDLNCDPGNNGYNDGSTTGTIVYRAVIQDQFTDVYPSGDASVDQGDELSNSVTITGTVLNNSNLTTTGNQTTDTSGVSESVPRDQLSKDFYAINGDTNLNHFKVDSKIHIKPGDVLTYELKYELTTSDVEDLYLIDFLPLPILDVDDPDADGTTGPAWTFTGKCGGATPAAGEACFGGDDTFYDYSTITPALASDVDGDGNPDDESNTLRFYYGDFDSPSNQAKTIHILFSVAVNTEPFADGLYLTNQVHVHEGSTNATAQDTESIINFVLDEPSLVHKKSVIASDNVNASITPALSGYTFTSPGSAGLRWTSPAKISSDYLNSHALNSDINGIDGGDLVSFAIVIENQGHSGGGAYDITIQDTIPAELQVPSAGYNLVIYYGDGSGPINYAKPDGSPATPVDLFGGGIQLVDPAGQGVCQSHDPNLGNNIIILTYDLQVIPGIAPDATLENEGTITNYSNVEGGDDFTGSGGSGQEGDLKDKATINITDPAVSKNITATSIDTTGSSQHNAALEDLTIGEEVTFEIVVTIPEGQSHPVTVTDNLPTSPTGVLSVVSSCITSIGASLSADSGTLPADRCPDSFGTHKNTDGDAYYDQVVFEFGNVNNTANGVVNDGDRIYLQVVARVEGHVDNQDGDVLANSVRVTAGAVTQSGSRDFEIVQPDLEITKTDYGDYFFSGGLLIYELTYQNNGTGTALGVTISDSVPIGTTFVAGSSSTGWVLPGTTTACPDSAAAGTVCEYPVGTLAAGAAAQTVNFAVRVDDPLSPAVTQIRNTARIDDQFAVDDMDNTNDSATDDDELANLGKSLVDTNQTFTLGQDVAIGEILTYRLVLFLPPHASGSGQMPVLTITDNLDAGLAFVDCLSVTPSSTNLTTDLTGDFADACSPNAANPTSGNPAIYPIPQTGAGSAADVNQGRQIVFDLGTVTNNGSVNETLTIEYRVAVLDSVDTLRGVNLNNAATALWGQHGTRNEATAMATDAMIVEPWYYLIKRADQTVVFKGATITFTLEVGHRAESDADGFDLVLTDPLPGSLHYVSGSLRIASGWNDGGNVVLNDSNPQKLRIAWDNFPLGQTSNVEFKAVLDRRAQESVENTAYLAWTSLPGDVTAAQSVFNPLSTERFYDPPSTVDIYGAFNSIIITIRGSRLPDTGYPPGEITVIEPDIDAKPYGLNDSIWLDIPTRQVHVPIVGIPLTEQGWNLTWLLEQAGYLGGTAYPTWPGNTVLTAHAYLPDGSSGPFMAIDQLKWGDSILLRTHDATYLYEVRQNYYVKANDLSPLYSSDGYDWLTLITCYQYDENIGGYRWRTVVRAVLMDVIDHVLDSVSP